MKSRFRHGTVNSVNPQKGQGEVQIGSVRAVFFFKNGKTLRKQSRGHEVEFGAEAVPPPAVGDCIHCWCNDIMVVTGWTTKKEYDMWQTILQALPPTPPRRRQVSYNR